MIEIQAPTFRDETEEAVWYFNNQDAIARQYLEAHPLPEFRQEIHLMLEAEDMVLARTQAESNGMIFEDYLRGVLHDALQRRKAA